MFIIRNFSVSVCNVHNNIIILCKSIHKICNHFTVQAYTYKFFFVRRGFPVAESRVETAYEGSE